MSKRGSRRTSATRLHKTVYRTIEALRKVGAQDQHRHDGVASEETIRANGNASVTTTQQHYSVQK